jgi:serine/threonine-protein phosphatase 4 regulatory subunit 4
MADFFSTEGEVPGKENLTALNASLQHEEKVQRHIESGNLAPHEVALYILANGSTGQKLSMLQHLGRTLKECDPKKTAEIFNELNAAMWTQELELQVQAPAALESILGMLNDSLILLLLGGARTMLDVKTDQVRKAWSQLILAMVPTLGKDLLMREMVPLALKKGDHSEPRDQRVFGCQLMGRLCRQLDGDTIGKTILTKAISLCQDTETSVRVAMCEQLGEVARAIGLERTKEKITAELFELLVDEEKLVSRAAFTSLIDLVEFFDPPYRREHFYPIIKSYITSPPEEVLSLLVDEFGRFLWKIKSDIQGAEDVTLFANFFRQSAQKPDPEVRRLCAYNLPAVVASLPLSVYQTHLSQLQRALSLDSHAPTRRAIAAGLHELCVLLGDKAALHLKDSFLALAQDANLSVRTVIMGHLSAILDVFSNQLKGDERDAFFNAIVPHICSFEAAVHRDWRKCSKLLESFPAFPRYFTGPTLHERFIPILVTHLVTGAAAMKEQCATLLVLFTKQLGSNMLIVEAFSKIVADFGRSPSCFNRMTFSLLFRHCANSYSRKFMRDRLLKPLLALAEDPVPNVRIQLVRVWPVVRRVMKAPVDAEYATLFNGAMQKLKVDTDSEVQLTLRSVAPEVEAIENNFARQVAMKVTNSPDDVKDREMEAAEGDLLEVAREQEKIEKRQKLREMLRSEAAALDVGPAGRPPGGKAPAGARRPPHGPSTTAPGAKPSLTTRPGVSTTRSSSNTRTASLGRR